MYLFLLRFKTYIPMCIVYIATDTLVHFLVWFNFLKVGIYFLAMNSGGLRNIVSGNI